MLDPGMTQKECTDLGNAGDVYVKIGEIYQRSSCRLKKHSSLDFRIYL